jgi:methionyl-tRNA formyltransferase
MTDSTPLRIVYFGTPDFATPTLKALAADNRFHIELVVTQPDRFAGRGHKLTPPPVKVAAEALGLQVYQPETLKTERNRAPLISANADFFVVAAFGLIFGQKTLAIPRLGSVNLHASLLPKYRGASPVVAAIACGDQQTGISVMKMEAGLDTGPVIATAKIDISHEDTTETLSKSLGDLAADLVGDELFAFSSGDRVLKAQSDAGASVVRPLVKDDGWLEWVNPASELERWVRATWPWPRAWTTINGVTLQVHRASVVDPDSGGELGAVLVDQNHVTVQTAEGLLELDIVQLPGGKPTPGFTLITSGKLRSGDLLGTQGKPNLLAPFVKKL